MSARGHDEELLSEIAEEVMVARGLEPGFSPAVHRELDRIRAVGAEDDAAIRDLRDLLWCSIDNDDSRDIDQITFAEQLPSGELKALVAVADVDAIVKTETAIDHHARRNTTSVYTPAKIFPMLPEKLSTDLTSLSENENRLALVMEMVVDRRGAIVGSDVYRAWVRNRAQLAYNSVSAGLENPADMPSKVTSIPDLAEQLRIQDRVAQGLRKVRHERGALEFETIEARAVLREGRVTDLVHERKNRARELIEDLMIGANGVTARFLSQRRLPSIRRVVAKPKRWERIVDLAGQFGDSLPAEPSSKALAEFLSRRRKADSLRFPDLSLAVIKLLGAGEYVLERPGQKSDGHFGLAVRDYAHSTAPNRRYPDLIIHRLLKAALQGARSPYRTDELTVLARHCTEQEDAADKVERQVRKSAAALLLVDRKGEHFDAIVTGASAKGTWVRTLHPPVEGKLLHGFESLDVGDKVRVHLLGVDVKRGYIDFAC